MSIPSQGGAHQEGCPACGDDHGPALNALIGTLARLRDEASEDPMRVSQGPAGLLVVTLRGFVPNPRLASQAARYANKMTMMG